MFLLYISTENCFALKMVKLMKFIFLIFSGGTHLFTGANGLRRRGRQTYTRYQTLELEKEFHYSRYITIRRKSELAQGLSLTERQVRRPAIYFL